MLCDPITVFPVGRAEARPTSFCTRRWPARSESSIATPCAGMARILRRFVIRTRTRRIAECRRYRANPMAHQRKIGIAMSGVLLIFNVMLTIGLLAYVLDEVGRDVAVREHRGRERDKDPDTA